MKALAKTTRAEIVDRSMPPNNPSDPLDPLDPFDRTIPDPIPMLIPFIIYFPPYWIGDSGLHPCLCLLG